MAGSQFGGAPNGRPKQNSQDSTPRANGTPRQGTNRGGRSTLTGPSQRPPRGQPWTQSSNPPVDVRDVPRDTQRNYYLAAVATRRPPYRDFEQRHLQSDIRMLENSFRNESSLNKILGN